MLKNIKIKYRVQLGYVYMRVPVLTESMLY